MIEKRTQKKERRHCFNGTKVSVRLINGNVISMIDQRKTPDRRIKNIQAEWVDEVVIG